MTRRSDADGGAGERFPRRLILKTLATGGMLLDSACGQVWDEGDSASTTHAVAVYPDHSGSPIRLENELLGSEGYGLGQPSFNGEIEAYSSPTTVAAGDTVQVFVHTLQAQGVRFEVYRIGYYQGLGGRLVSSGDRLLVSPQPMPLPDPSTGLIECAWQVTFSIRIEPAWVTGYYLVKLIADDGFETHSPFVVRESGRTAPLLAQASATTWQAYNGWGGVSLYHNQTDQSQFAGGRGYRVSFDRPYLLSEQVWLEEWAMARWLEQRGYDVAYVTNMDLDRAPELLNGRKLLLSVGHDEYWSLNARNAVQSARDLGLCIAFFSGNTSYRRIRLDSASNGGAHRIVTCYKSATLDPVSDAPDTTADFGSEPFPRPEVELLGLDWAGWAYLNGFPFVVTNPDHWVYEGTGVQANDTLGHIIGYEWDCVGDSSPDGVEIIGDSPVVHEYGYTSRSNAIVFYPTPTSFVFSAGTIGWGKALGLAGYIDPRLQRVTQNILARANVLPELEAVAEPTPEPAVGSSARSQVVAGSGTAGMLDGAALVAQFSGPTGVAAGLAGELYVCDTDNQAVRKISADGQVTTLVGPGSSVKTSLTTPTGIAVDSAGVVYVSDTGNDRILAIDLDGHVRIFAGGGRAGSADAKNPRRAQFNGPRGIAVDSSGVLYVADKGNDAIRRIDGTGVSTLVTSAGGPTAIAFGPDGTLYYVATWNGSIVSRAPDGTLTTLANVNSYGDQVGPGMTAQLRPVEGLAYTPGGLLLSDTGNNRMRFVAFDAQNTVTNVLGDGRAGAGVGIGADTQVVLPRGLAAFNGGYVVADSMNHRILWFSLDA